MSFVIRAVNSSRQAQHKLSLETNSPDLVLFVVGAGRSVSPVVLIVLPSSRLPKVPFHFLRTWT